MRITSKTISYTVNTVDELLTLVGEDNQTVVVTDKDRGGTFVYRSADSAVNNGGIIFNGWNRQYSGSVNVKWFGAKGDGITDDTNSFQKAITDFKTIYVPNGNFIISSPIVFPNNGTIAYSKNIIGNDKSKGYGSGTFIGDSVITYTGNGTLFQFRGVSGTEQIDCGQVAIDSIKIYASSNVSSICLDTYKAVGLTIRNTVISGFNIGLRIERWFYYSIIDNTSIIYCNTGLQTGYLQDNTTTIDGIWNNAVIQNSRISSCTMGIKSYQAGIGVNIKNTYFESNATAVTLIEFASSLFDSCYFENNSVRCLDLQGYSLIANKYSITNITNCLINTPITEPIRYRRNQSIILNNSYIQNASASYIYLFKQYTSGELLTLDTSSNKTSDTTGLEVYLLSATRISTWRSYNCDLALRTIGSSTTMFPNTVLYDNSLGGTLTFGIANTASFLNIDAPNVTSADVDVQIGRSTSTSGKVSTHFYKGGTEGVKINHGDKAINLSKVRFGLTDSDTSAPTILTGAGTPEGVASAAIGSLYLRIDGGASTSLYVKQSGAGNTGWVAK